MEFERSLFRVHEKIISSLIVTSRSRQSYSKITYIRALLFLNLFLSIILFILLFLLHISFVGNGSCLSATLQNQGIEPKIIDVTKVSNLTINDNIEQHHLLLSDCVIRVWSFPNQNQQQVQQFSVWSISEEEILSHADNTFRKPDYEFSADPAFLLIDESLRYRHNVKQWNITLETQCLGIWGRYSLLKYIIMNYFLDEIVVNQFIHGLENSEGVLRSQTSHESWSWSHSTTQEYVVDHHASLLYRFVKNLIIFWRSFVLFLLVSSITALMVRTLVSSGVAIMFPVFYCLRSFGLVPHDIFRLLTLSYPWIGGDVELLESSQQNMTPLIRAHLVNVLVTYAAYEASQFAWRRWLLGFKPQPQGLEVWGIFAYIMVCEYFLLLFARSPTTLRYLPRFLALIFLAFIQYTLSVPYGFTSLAALIMWTFSVFWMIYFIIECEVKALARGIVSIESPRAFFTALPTPQWPISLPPHWSTFHELNRVNRSVYDDDADNGDDEHDDNDIEEQRDDEQEILISATNDNTLLAHRRNRNANNNENT